MTALILAGLKRFGGWILAHNETWSKNCEKQ